MTWIVIWTMRYCEPYHTLYNTEPEARQRYNELREHMQHIDAIRRIEIGEVLYKDAFDRRRLEKCGEGG